MTANNGLLTSDNGQRTIQRVQSKGCLLVPSKRPLVLIVRDGWGKNPYPQWNKANAVYLAKHPVADRLMAEFPNVLIHTSGFDVGLPEGTMGNSEVGHQNIGAGRVVDQESVAITKQCRDGAIYDNQVLNAAVSNALEKRSKLHLFGIVSDAGVHGLLEHLYACLALAKKRGLERVYLHAFTDGRDTPPNSGLGYIQQIEAKMREIGVGQVATVTGRYWAMDRDNRWDRVQRAYLAMTQGEGARFSSAQQAIKSYYDNPTAPNMSGDEFVAPSVITKPDGLPIATVGPNDSIIFYNYRGDRPREITKAFVYDEFPFIEKLDATDAAGKPIKTEEKRGFDRGPKIPGLYFATMTAYEKGLPVNVAYPKPPKMLNTLGEYVSNLGLKQFRSAETEKFPHVTFFFNDYREAPFPGEERQIVPSPKLLPDGQPLRTYDQMPEMSAYGVCDEVVKRVNSGQFDLIVVNFANGDMVGHTGVLEAAVKAVEHVDICCGRILDALQRQGGTAIVTADHGNCEQMIDPTTGGPHTAHTTYDVECVLVDDRLRGKKLREGGRLADLAPTALQMMGLEKPGEMTGTSLIG
jgi:2,3-bisphosphoglycerate-independent phosphoglycerate mutase